MGQIKQYGDQYVTGGEYVVGASTFAGKVACSSDLSVAYQITATKGVIDPIQTIATTATAIHVYGLTNMASTLAGTKNYKLGVPGVAGVRKTVIVGTQSGSSSVVQVTCTGGSFLSTAGATKKRFTAASSGMSIELMSASTVAWQVLRQNVTAFSTAIS